MMGGLFQQKIAKEAKTNPKGFYKYALSKMKTTGRSEE
jgi:hypothetical protein